MCSKKINTNNHWNLYVRDNHLMWPKSFTGTKTETQWHQAQRTCHTPVGQTDPSCMITPGQTQVSQIMATIDGWITLVVDPVLTKPITSTSPIFMGRYKLLVPSDSNSIFSLIVQSISPAADSRVWVAATAGFLKMSELHWQCPEHYQPLSSTLLSAESGKQLAHHERVHKRDTVWWSVLLSHKACTSSPWPCITIARCGSPLSSLLWSSLLKLFL